MAAHRKYKAWDLFVNVKLVFCLFEKEFTMQLAEVIVGRHRQRDSVKQKGEGRVV